MRFRQFEFKDVSEARDVKTDRWAPTKVNQVAISWNSSAAAAKSFSGAAR
jgi:hypothetical protein